MYGNGAATGIVPIIINSKKMVWQKIQKDLLILMILLSRAYKKRCSVVVHFYVQINIAHATWLVREVKANTEQPLTIWAFAV